MATLNSAPSRFLNLPSELRLIIYIELLTTIGAITLYHDQRGRESSLGLCPTILRVSRQIYNESVWLLYERNVFLIGLTTEINEICIRVADDPLRQSRWHQRAGLPTPRKPDLLRIRDYSTGEDQGLVYPHCFRRFRHIGLVTAGDAVIGLKFDTPFYSDTYSLVIDILKCLVADDGFDWMLGASESSYAGPEEEKQKPLSQQKSLDFVLLRHERITTPRPSSNFEEMDIMANLLAEVGRKRDLVTQNMVECMRNVQQWQAHYSSEKGRSQAAL